MRVTFKYNQCGETSIMAQQIKDPEGGYTFRKWNPLKENVPFEDHTDAEPDQSRGPLLFCYMCEIVSWCFGTLFEEAIDLFVDGSMEPEEYFRA